ncbi:MAG: T9SS type A sorting domain-containing protein [Lewinellaceae bacterium]|nr:T9SS type A sorting domain-containing protein [Lewinellaceae bacterium]
MLLTFGVKLMAQCEPPTGFAYLNGNQVRAYISSTGGLFFDGEKAGFQHPANESLYTIYAQGLWLGAIDLAGNLHIAAQTYGPATGKFDYYPGPLTTLDAPNPGETNRVTCSNWDRVWEVHRHQIEAHRSDWSEDGHIDNPDPAILGWPAKGNPHFEDIYGFELPNTPAGLAPFRDINHNGLYDPLSGDYPTLSVEYSNIPNYPIPEQITWSMFNDNGNLHLQTSAAPLKFEIQLTTWAFNCPDSPLLSNTIFTAYTLINRAIEPMDSVHLGLWLDFALGCPADDYLGSAPFLNTVFTYNADNIDGDMEGGCEQGVNSYGVNPPVQAVTVLNKDIAYAAYYGSTEEGYPAGAIAPVLGLEYYRYLTGHWRDGSPLTFGSDGFIGAGAPTPFAFPDAPTDPNGWSEYSNGLQPGNKWIIPSIALGNLTPGSIRKVYVAYTFIQEEGANHLENLQAMYEGIESLQQWYDYQIIPCVPPPTCQEGCIWAGDANADGIANHNDLLPIGLALNSNGPTRPAPYNWSPRQGENWGAAQFNGANFKHIDADGNGHITIEDFELTLTHYNFKATGFNQADEYPEGPELKLVALNGVNLDSLSAGQQFFLRVLLEDIPGLCGVAFSLEYDKRYFEELELLGFSGFNPLAMKYTKGFPELGQVDFAYILPSGNGHIEESVLLPLRAKTVPDFSGPIPSDTTRIRLKNIKAVRNDGNELEIGGTSIAAVFPNVMTSTAAPERNNPILLSPNPTAGEIHLSTFGKTVDAIALFSSTGQRLWQKTGGIHDGEALQLAHLPEGLYYLHLIVDTQHIIRKIIVQQD